MVTLEGLTRSPLAASYTISYPVEESWEFVDLQLELVYKDGSSVTIDGGGGKAVTAPTDRAEPTILPASAILTRPWICVSWITSSTAAAVWRFSANPERGGSGHRRGGVVR